VAKAILLQLQEREQQPASEAGAISSQLHVSQELIITEARSPGDPGTGFSLDRGKHALAHLAVGGLTHHRQHLEWRQCVKSSTVIPQIEGRHKKSLSRRPNLIKPFRHDRRERS
jgi:hypothetical protein